MLPLGNGDTFLLSRGRKDLEMEWFTAHWKAVGVSVLLFLLGAAIGTSGSSSKSSTTTIIRDHTVTVAGAAPSASTVIETETVTHTLKAKPKPAAKKISFSGNGGETLPAFVVGHDSTLRWTNDGDIFQIFDMNPNDFGSIGVNSQAHSGSTAVSAGRYSKIEVNAIGNWTITIS
jgi:hypothetical protein